MDVEQRLIQAEAQIAAMQHVLLLLIQAQPARQMIHMLETMKQTAKDMDEHIAPGSDIAVQDYGQRFVETLAGLCQNAVGEMQGAAERVDQISRMTPQAVSNATREHLEARMRGEPPPGNG